MKPTSTVLITAGAIAVSVFTLVALANNTPSGSRPAPAVGIEERVERGRYLVHQVGLCIDCHSPRDSTGEFIVDRHLTGSPLAFAPTVPMPWMPVAPRIAGLPAGYTDESMAHFLMTGERPNNLPPPLPPMPPYRMNRADAGAVVDYLKTLPVDAH